MNLMVSITCGEKKPGLVQMVLMPHISTLFFRIHGTNWCKEGLSALGGFALKAKVLQSHHIKKLKLLRCHSYLLSLFNLNGKGGADNLLKELG